MVWAGPEAAPPQRALRNSKWHNAFLIVRNTTVAYDSQILTRNQGFPSTLSVARLHSPRVRRPDDLVHLQLEPDRQGIGQDALGQFAARERQLAGGNFLL